MRGMHSMQKSGLAQMQHPTRLGSQHLLRRARPSLLRAAASTVDAPPADLLARVQQLEQWVQAPRTGGAAAAPPPPLLRPKRFKSDAAPGAERVGFIAAADAAQGATLLQLPESLAVTSVDAEKHPLVGAAAAESGQLVALALWLLAERAAGPASPWAPLLATLPAAADTPIRWPDAERAQLLAGSPVLREARERDAQLRAQWSQLSATWFDSDASRFDRAVFNEAAFVDAFTVVVAHTTYLPSAQCFALLPLVSLLPRTGNGTGCDTDYDEASGSVRLLASRPFREGQEVVVNDERPNGELLLATGAVQDDNLSDCLMMEASLVMADKYYQLKEQVLASMGYTAAESFPVYANRFPLQLLSYLRLSRIQDPGLLAKVNFNEDLVITQMNEYEVLQLLMGECRERLAAYGNTLEEDVKALQIQGPQALVGRARVAARLRVAEKSILSRTMDGVRQKLAPIRGIPTKSGQIQDPNSDLKEIFEMIEDLPNKPAKLIDNFKRWARGEFDPDWNK